MTGRIFYNGNEVGSFILSSSPFMIKNVFLRSEFIDVENSSSKVLKLTFDSKELGFGTIVGQGLFIGFPFSTFTSAFFVCKDRYAN